MRLEATLPDPRAEQLAALADELQTSKSALIEEALTLLFTGVLEARRGRRIAIVDAQSERVVSQLATSSLSQIEWAAHRERISVREPALARAAELVEKCPAPGPALRRAMGKARRKRGR
jgi:hypothetical protein